MSVRVRLFAVFREIAGAPELELPAGQARTVGEAWGRLLARYPDLNDHVPTAAVNASYAVLNDKVRDGDEVAFLPPVSGG